jgi:tetratricopeptide (TPR) repeat protein
MTSRAKRAGGSKPLKRRVVLVPAVHKKKAAVKPRPRPKPKLKVQKLVEDPRLKLAREQYETGLGLLNGHKYEKAIAWFEKVMASPVGDLADRARVHISICRKRMERSAPTLRSAEDHYNYAVAQINAGALGDAEEHLNRAMKLMPHAGHLHYALAAVQALRSEVSAALGNLKTAIDLDQRNRYLARNDRDFAALHEDPRFADLVYPEKGPDGN